jgi:hypothetical protein
LSRFPVAFPLPAFASRSSDSRRGVGPSSRSAYRPAQERAGPRRGSRVPRAQAATRVGASYIPRTAVLFPVWMRCPAGACRSTTASPSTPLQHPTLRSAASRDIGRRFTFFTRLVCPSPVAARVERAPLGFPPSFTPRRYRRRTSRAGPGHRARTWTTRSTSHLSILQSVVHSMRATSRRTLKLSSVLSAQLVVAHHGDATASLGAIAPSPTVAASWRSRCVTTRGLTESWLSSVAQCARKLEVLIE